MAKLTIRFQLMLSKELETALDDFTTKLGDKYEGKGHVIRCALIKLYCKEFGQWPPTC